MSVLLFNIWWISFLSPPTPLHDFHSSIAEMNYNAQTKNFEVILRVFTDDLEGDINRLNEGEKILIDFAGKDTRASQAITNYLATHFYLQNKKGQKSKIVFVKREADVEATTVYFKIPYKGNLRNITFHNKILLDLFDDQSNIVNLRYKAQKKTLLFKKGKSKHILNF
ncbi:MAG: DUF6702 family protein [Thermonemataceae bacterium]